ncbi:sensory box/GGDEF family protein [Deinococcus aerius]|uniref:Sensory box/GGDEF family protein n=1 Tax=Deinococcus aerius TaxID=200253 RepID=A0A2I9CZN5_9DEIO|nr:EAL domain-containing protein [Deinococcus aerius]GBF07704.1 sensory box/GGDEF family protein [Deinococcus aerius]
MLRGACAQVLAWRRPGGVPPELCVHFSGRHFAAPDVYTSLAGVLGDLGFDPRALRLEITEGVLLEHSQTIGETLARIRELGVGLSLDDFGTGYSSLGDLQFYPVDTPKIDRSFVHRMTGNGESTELVRTIIQMAKNLRLRVVAEGASRPRPSMSGSAISAATTHRATCSPGPWPRGTFRPTWPASVPCAASPGNSRGPGRSSPPLHPARHPCLGESPHLAQGGRRGEE